MSRLSRGGTISEKFSNLKSAVKWIIFGRFELHFHHVIALNLRFLLIPYCPMVLILSAFYGSISKKGDVSEKIRKNIEKT